MVIEMSPELKQAFADLNGRLDSLDEKLGKLSEPMQVKLCGRDLQGLKLSPEDYRAARTT